MTTRGAVATFFDYIVNEYGDWWTLQLIPLCSPNSNHMHEARGRKEGSPCKSPGKVPVIQAWQRKPEERRRAQVTPKQVAADMATHVANGGNVGLAIPRGVIALDADTADSAARLAAICSDGPFQRSGRGGHAILRLPDGVDVSNSCKVTLEPGLEVDLRGHGSQIVVCPSVHQSGVSYEWDWFLANDPTELPLVPAAVVPVIEKHTRNGKSRRTDDEWQALAREGVREGHRHSSLAALSGKVFRSNLDPVTAYEFLHSWNAARCDPPLPRDEADRVICDIATREMKGGRQRWMFPRK